MSRPKRQTKEERKAYVLRWRRENPDKNKAYQKKWITANKKQRREIERAWQRANPEKRAAINARSGAKWTANNRGRRNAITAARRASIRERMPPWVNRAEFLPFYEMAARLTKNTGIPHEVDHVIPLKGIDRSGLHVPANLRIITRQANRSKGFRT